MKNTKRGGVEDEFSKPTKKTKRIEDVDFFTKSKSTIPRKTPPEEIEVGPTKPPPEEEEFGPTKPPEEEEEEFGPTKPPEEEEEEFGPMKPPEEGSDESEEKESKLLDDDFGPVPFAKGGENSQEESDDESESFGPKVVQKKPLSKDYNNPKETVKKERKSTGALKLKGMVAKGKGKSVKFKQKKEDTDNRVKTAEEQLDARCKSKADKFCM